MLRNHESIEPPFLSCQESSVLHIHRPELGLKSEANDCESEALGISLPDRLSAVF